MVFRPRRVGSVLGLTLLVATLSPSQTSASSVTATDGTPLPFARTAYDMVVAGDHVFITGGTGEDGVEVHGLSGRFVKRVSSPGASGMVLIGEELFVAATDADRIDVIDTAVSPPVKSRSIGIGPFSAPGDLAFVDGRLWFPARESEGWVAVGVAPDGSDLTSGAVLAGIEEATRLAPGPSGSGILFATVLFRSPAPLLKYDVSSDPPSLVEQITAADGAAGLEASPSGDSVIVAGAWPDGSGYGFPELASDTLELIRTYEGLEFHPSAVSVSGARDGILATGSLQSLFAYELGNPSPLWSGGVGGTPGFVTEISALAWSPDGMRLFAVGGSVGDPDHRLYVRHPWAQPSGLTLNLSTSTIDFGRRLRVLAHLEGGTTNRVVRVFGKPINGTTKLLKEGTVDAQGNLAFRYAPQRHTELWATYGGDPEWLPAVSSRKTVKVRVVASVAMRNRDGTSGRYALYRFATSCTARGHTDCPLALGRVAPDHPRAPLTFALQIFRNGAWRAVLKASYRLRSNSTVAVVFWYTDRRVIGVPTRVKVSFAKDADHLGDTSDWAYFKVVP